MLELVEKTGLFTGEIRDLPTVLYVPVVHPCMTSEMLCVSVDIMKGQYLVSIAEKGELVKRQNHSSK